MRKRIISVGLERPSTPCDRLLATAELELRNSRARHPEVSHRIARTEAQGLDRMSFGFFGVTDENLTKSDAGMCVCEISIQRQRIFAFGEPSPAHLVHMSTNPNADGRGAWSGTDDRALVNFVSAAANAEMGSVAKELEASTASAPADPISAST